MSVESEAPGSAGQRSRDDRSRNPLVRMRTYYREVVAELRKVIYPTRSELVTYTIVVVVFVAAMVAIISGFDLGFTHLDLLVFG
ncbi:MAG TPA: preprotein translocase subunit SecE [Mycobacteriales bacterium]